MTERKIRLGVAGLGRAFTLMLPTLVGDPRVQLVAAADPRPEARRQFETDFGARTYDSVDALCGHPAVEAVYIATPHQHHAQHVELAAAHGKHVLVEKPMAIALEQCAAMIDAARRANIHLIVGHSHSFNAPILRTRAMIASGVLGQVRMIHALNYTDYMVRPRRPEELDTAQGGGVMFSQAAHQIDIVRLLGGGMVKSVRGTAGNWDPSRPTEGAYSAFMTFDNGAFASVAYSGYAHFDSDELTGWIGEMGIVKDPARYGEARKALRDAIDGGDESAVKNARNYGGRNYRPSAASLSRFHQHFGPVVVSCERGDLRPVPAGVIVYRDDKMALEPVPVRDVQRAEVIDELYGAVVNGRTPVHSGAWAMATLELCLAILQSGREGKELTLRHQCAAADLERSPTPS